MTGTADSIEEARRETRRIRRAAYAIAPEARSKSAYKITGETCQWAIRLWIPEGEK